MMYRAVRRRNTLYVFRVSIYFFIYYYENVIELPFLSPVKVSWIRLPDWRIVASGRHIYNKDERFRVLHAEGTPEWTLQIKYAALIDQGLYECQVSIFSFSNESKNS